MSLFIADYAFTGESARELSLPAGARVRLLLEEEQAASDWLYGELISETEASRCGYFPRNFGRVVEGESPFAHLSIGALQERRNVAMMSILRSEKDYAKDLSEFISLFINPMLLLDTPFKRQLLGDASLSLLLDLVVEIHGASRQLVVAGKAHSDELRDALAMVGAFDPALALRRIP